MNFEILNVVYKGANIAQVIVKLDENGVNCSYDYECVGST